MAVKTFDFTIESRGYCHIEDITARVQECVDGSELRAGLVCVAVAGSTAAVSTVEYEPGLLKDLPRFFEELIPSDRRYHHDDTWHDGNGFAHLRSFLVKTSHTIPFSDKKLLLGTWQQVVLADFDNRPRRRKVIVQLVGD